MTLLKLFILMIKAHARKIVFPSILLQTLLFAGHCFCQDANLSPFPAWLSEPINETWSVALGDIDGDGDLDLACGNKYQSSTIYLNDNGTLQTSPVWSSYRKSATYSVALGDIDGDGDLDLVCGNSGQRNTLYINDNGVFQTLPAWSSEPTNYTYSVALGDIDGDGDLDLVCGNSGQRNTLYLNDNGTLRTSPAWSSEPTNGTLSVALGDIDGDGDLDLVCGNSGSQINTLYLNDNGTFQTSPAWLSGPTNSTFSAALGDIDGDGDLDLVCGNGGSQINTLYLNDNGTFQTSPAWLSGPTNYTYSAALGDIDGDGDLDLVCGNSGQNTLYLNDNSALQTSPVWSSGPTNSTMSVALGDIDGNGDLDLVCGNYYDSNTLYLNDNGALQTSPAWSSEPANRTQSVALGDIDGDGDLDLVCGNSGQRNTLYLNDNGALQTSPVWSSGPTNHTYSVALGDIDGDGDPDLVCGNSGQNTLYLNDNSALQTSPVWSSGPTNSTMSVALGDIDGNGDLDLVCGNYYYDSNTLYLNDNGTFQTSPAWEPEFANETWSVALGDIDGDGDLDLVCGNSGQRNTLYLNDNGTLRTSPAWSSEPTNYTRSVALGDIDGDGDLDLVCGNNSQITLYLNDNGLFHTSPAWEPEFANATWSVALGDIDGDGDLDLVCGNNQRNMLHAGKGAPVFKGDPPSPRNHLANNGAFLQSVRAEKIDRGHYRIHFTAVDVESDPVWLMPEYHYMGNPTWHTVITEGHAGKAGPFDTSPAGVGDSIDWDTYLLPFDTRNVVLRLRVIEMPKRVSIIQHVAPYLKKIGPIEPYRAMISTSTDALSFATVTVGDTVTADLVIGNMGNLVLSVAAIDLPSSEMRISRPAPFDLAPGEQDTLIIYSEPRTELTVTGPVQIMSNDPLQPSTAISVSTDIRALIVGTELLTQTDEIPLGEAVTAIITPAPDVRVEQGYLLYRPGGSAHAFADSVALTRSQTGFVTVIPGEGVTEAGLEYYIRVENSEVFATDPPGAPGAFFSQAVKSPVLVLSNPRPNSSLGFLENNPVYIDVLLEQGAAFVDGTIHYRLGGESEYREAGPTSLEPGLVFSIPDSLVGPRGIEYWIEVNTLTRTLSDPALAPTDTPHTIQVTVRNLEEPYIYSGEQYRMTSIPLFIQDYWSITYEALLIDQPEFGPYDPIQWRAYRYINNDEIQRYVELSEEMIEELFQPFPGVAIWLVSRDPNRITTAPAIGFSTHLIREGFSVILNEGWTMIGNPYNFPVAWDSCLIDSIPVPEAEARGIIEPPIRWSSGHGYQQNVEILIPFEGYWVNVLDSPYRILVVPPKEAPAPGITNSPEFEMELVDGRNWRIAISAKSADAADACNAVGIFEEASTLWDCHDRSEPPMSPGRSISLYFPHTTWERHPGFYTEDIRGTYEELNANKLGFSIYGEELWGHLWRFDVAKNFTEDAGGDEMVLDFGGVESAPAGAVVFLIDRHLSNQIDLRTENTCRFFLGQKDFVSKEEDARFVLLVGSEEFVGKHEDELPKPPTATALHQNYPNPFNPSTVVRCDIAAPGAVELKIYDIRGTLVKTLLQEHRDPGRYEIGWDGTNNAGLRVASGIYFYRLEASAGFSETRKMLLIR